MSHETSYNELSFNISVSRSYFENVYIKAIYIYIYIYIYIFTPLKSIFIRKEKEKNIFVIKTIYETLHHKTILLSL